MSCVLLPVDCTTLFWEYVAQFDVMGTDPPYSRKVHADPVSCSASGGESLGVAARDFGFGHLTPKLRRWLARAANTVKRWSLFYSDVESATWLRISCEAVGAEYVRTIPWDRWSQPQMSGDRPPSGCEDVVVAYRGDRLVLTHKQYVGARGGRKPLAKEWSGPGNLTALRHASLRGGEKYSAEKPLDQALSLVSWFSRPGELWFDPCAGRATFGRACQILGRRYVGCESLGEAFAAGETRLASSLAHYEAERLERFVTLDGAEARRLLEQSGTVAGLENSRRRMRDWIADTERAAEYLKKAA